MASNSKSAQEAMRDKATLMTRISELEQTVIRLESQLQVLNKKTRTTQLGPSLIRRVGVWLLILLCSLSFALSAVALWVNRTITMTDVWVQKTSNLIEEPAVRSEISKAIAKQIFTQVNVETYIADILPPQIDGLATPLTNSLKTTVGNTITSTLASDTFMQFWTKSNQSAHQGIMLSIKNGGTATDEIRQNNIVFINDNRLILNLRPVFNGLKEQLIAQGLSFLDGVSGERIKGEVTLATIPQMHRVLAVIYLIDRTAAFLPVLAAVFGAGAIALSTKKRRTMMGIGWVTVVLMVALLQLISFAQYPFMGMLPNTNTAASSAAFIILTQDLVTICRTILLLALVLLLAGFLTGPSRLAAFVQQSIGRFIHPTKASGLLYLIGTNSRYVIGGVSTLAVLLIVFPFSKTPAYMLSVASIAIVLSLITLGIQQAIRTIQAKTK